MWKIRVNAKATRRKLKKSERAARNLSAAFREIGRIVTESVARNFEVEGRPRWKRRRDRKSHTILDKTGKLRRSIKARADRSGVTIKASASHGVFHQLGTRTIPKRPFLVLQEQDERDIAKAIMAHIKGDLT